MLSQLLPTPNAGSRAAGREVQAEEIRGNSQKGTEIGLCHRQLAGLLATI